MMYCLGKKSKYEYKIEKQIILASHLMNEALCEVFTVKKINSKEWI